MEVLRCDAGGEATYRYQGYTRKTDELHIRNDDELYARLPLGAAQLSAELERANELRLVTRLVGAYELDSVGADLWERLPARCQDATHVIRSVHVGAYELGTVAATEAGVEAGWVGGPQAGASSRHSYSVLSRDGDMAACESAPSGDGDAPSGCGAMVRVEVVPAPLSAAGAPMVAAHDDDARPKASASKKMTIAGGVLTAAGGAMLITGVGGYATAARANTQVEDAIARDDLDAREAAVRRGLRADTAGVTGIVSAAVLVPIGVALLVVGRRRRANADDAAWRVTASGLEVKF
jgi:hypothetical protein